MFCNKCLENKPKEDFSAHSKTRCKKCRTEYVKTWARNNSDLSKAISKRTKTKNKERINAYYKAWYAKNGRKRNSKQAKAHSIVFTAIKAGTLLNPGICECCNNEIKTEAHHDNYNKPLDVAWMCRPCHRAKHTGR